MGRRRPAAPEPEVPLEPPLDGPLADVLAVLAAGAPHEGLAAAIDHAVKLAASGPAPARELEEVLRRLVPDARPLDPGQGWRGTVGNAAQSAHASVIVASLATGRAGAREEGPAPEWVRQALDQVLLAALGRDDGPDRESHASRVAALASTWVRIRLVEELDVAKALLAALEDGARSTWARWAARLTLEVFSRQKSAPELVAIAAAASRRVEQLLVDRAAPEDLRRLVLASAHTWNPGLDVEDLQRRGLAATLPLPPSTTREEALQPLFDEVDREQLRRVLDAGTDVPLLATALALVPHLVRRWPARWRDWEPRVRALLDRAPAAPSAYAALLPALAPWKDELRPLLVDAFRRALPALVHLDSLAAAARTLFGPGEPLIPLVELLVAAVRGAPALPWERRFACHLVLVERWRERAQQADEALADVLAATADEAIFWKGLGLLARRGTVFLEGRVASGASARRPLPSVERLHVAGGDQYNGFYCDLVAERVQAAIVLVPPEEVLACVERPDHPGRVCAAMHLLPTFAERDRTVARRAEEAAVPLITDARVHRADVESSGQHSPWRGEGFALAPAARGLVLTLAARAGAERQAELALACLARALEPEHVAASHDSDLRDLLTLWSRPGVQLTTWAALGSALADAVGDRARAAPVRLRAFEALRYAEKLKGLAATLDPEHRRAKAALVGALRAPREEDPALVAHVRTHLATIDPDAVASLQGQGHIEVEGVPPLAELLRPTSQGTPRLTDSTSIRLAGVAARPEQVIVALRGRDPDGVLAALLLVPEVASRASWKQLAGALLPHVTAGGWNPIVVNNDSMAKLAATHLVAAVDLPARAGDSTARGLLLDALSRLIAAESEAYPTDVEQVLRACVAPLVACAGPPADLLDLVRPWISDRTRSRTARFRALRLLLEQRDAAAKDLLVALLRDPTDDPGLRALAGTIAWNHAQTELEPLLLRKKRPWTLASPGTPRLPIVEPADVPTEWLIASLELARDEDTRRRALWRLEARLTVKDDLASTSQQLRRAAARHRGLVAALRAQLDASLEGTWNHQAKGLVQLLALLGRPQDTGRVARAMLRLSWRMRCSDPACGRSHETPSQQVRDTGRSELDEHIAVGFRAGADRVRARAWLQLGREHLLADRAAEAVDALRTALELAPRSREIARELRAAQA